MLFHGDTDELVSVQYSYNMFAAMPAAGVHGDLKIIEGGTHGLDVYGLIEARTYMSQ